jgi:hypothetical protein
MDEPSVIQYSAVGPHPSDNNALKLRHDGQEQGACVPWVAGCICFGAGAGQPHPFTGCKHRQGEGLRGSGSAAS